MQYLGDYAEDYATLNFKFSTHQADGTPITLAGTPALSVYKASSTTQSTAGITLSVDFDGVTGLHNVLIDLSADAFYATGNDYAVVITTGTVDSVSVVGTVIAHFSIENRFKEATLAASQIIVKKNALLNNFGFTMMDASDHVTPKAGLTVSGERSIDGAAFAACANAVTEISDGAYKINLAATDLNGDVIIFRFTATGGDELQLTILTQP